MPLQVVISAFNAPRGLRRLRDKEANRNEATCVALHAKLNSCLRLASGAPGPSSRCSNVQEAKTHLSALLACTDSAFAQFEGIVCSGMTAHRATPEIPG